ncbi:MAG: PDZ domain-containing protein [Pirellulales bacterium]|nr:PDZ domain-containing protein [Pirellulales bacterium]
MKCCAGWLKTGMIVCGLAGGLGWLWQSGGELTGLTVGTTNWPDLWSVDRVVSSRFADDWYFVDEAAPPAERPAPGRDGPERSWGPGFWDQLTRRDAVRYPGDEGKNHTRIKDTFRPIVAQTSKSVVRIYCDNEPATLGLIVNADGQILTKASQLKGHITCQVAGGKKYPLTVLGVLREHDLALGKIDAPNLAPADWRKAETPPLGNFLITPDGNGDVVALGVVSVAPRKISAPSGILGILLGQTDRGPKIERVLEGSAAEQAGLLVNDVILQVNEWEVKSRESMIELIGNFRPGEKLSLKILRNGTKLEIGATLGRPETGRPVTARGFRRTEDERLAGDLSERRGGFAQALQHDTVLRPYQCGGPVVDLDGKVAGINIARADRVASYALPANVVQEALRELQTGKHPAGPELQGTNADRLREKIQQLQEALASAEKSQAATNEEVEKLRAELEKTDEPSEKLRDSLDKAEKSHESAVAAEQKARQELANAQKQLRQLD